MNVSNPVCSNSARPLPKENQGSGASCSTWIGQRGIKSRQLPVDFGKRNMISQRTPAFTPVIWEVSSSRPAGIWHSKPAGAQDNRISNVGNAGQSENEISEGASARVICVRSGIADAITVGLGGMPPKS